MRAHSLAAAADADTISKALPGKAARKRRKKTKYWELVKNGMGQKKKNKKKHFLGVLCLCNCVCVCVRVSGCLNVEKKKIKLALRV